MHYNTISDSEIGLELKLLKKGSGLILMLVPVHYFLEFILNTFLSKVLSPSDYGDYSLALYTIHLLAFLLMFGSEKSFHKFVPGYYQTEDFGKIRGFMIFFAGIVLVVSILLSLLLFLLAVNNPLQLGSSSGEGIHPIVLASWFIFFYAYREINEKTLRLERKLLYSYIPSRIMYPLLAIAITLFFYLTMDDFFDLSAVLATCSAMAIVVFMQIYLISKHINNNYYNASPNFSERKKWIKESLPMMYSHSFLFFTMFAALFIIEIRSLDSKVGVFALITEIAKVYIMLYMTVYSVMASRVSKVLETDNIKSKQLYLSQAVRIIFLTGSVFFAGIIFLGNPFLTYIGKSYAEAYYALLVLCGGYFINALTYPAYVFMDIAGYEKTSALISLTAFLVTLPAVILLLPEYDIFGAAAGTALGLTVGSVLNVIFLYKKLKLNALKIF